MEERHGGTNSVAVVHPDVNTGERTDADGNPIDEEPDDDMVVTIHEEVVETGWSGVELTGDRNGS